MSVQVPSGVAEALQGHLDGLNEQAPPDYSVPWTSKVFRHPCPRSRVARQTGRATSVGIDLHERYVTDPSGEWAIIYREGRCSGCKVTCRSQVGRIVATAERPPIEGRVGR